MSVSLCGYEVAEMEEEGSCFEMSEEFCELVLMQAVTLMNGVFYVMFNFCVLKSAVLYNRKIV